MMKNKKIFEVVFDFFDTRLRIKETIDKDLCKTVPQLNWTYYFGGVSASLFMLQLITGILLFIYYQPTTEEAYNSVTNITSNIPFGWLIRGMHVWGAHLMIVALFCHMSRVFFQASYKNPREINWMIGTLLLLGTLTFSFTGYLLPWTQLSYWATTVGTEVPGSVPFIGDYIKILIRGGENISQVTLSRFFVLHVTVLPLAVLLLAAIHLMIVRLLGISEPVSNLSSEIKIVAMDQKQNQTKKEKYKGATMPFYIHILKDIQVVFIIIGVLVTLAVFSPPGLDGKADPFVTPEHIKPEWYFLSGYQLLKLADKLSFLGDWAPKIIGVGLQGVIGFIFFMMPILDGNPERAYRKRKAIISAGIISVFLFAFLTVWGHFS